MQVFLSIETKRFEIEFIDCHILQTTNPQLGICEKTDFSSRIRNFDLTKSQKFDKHEEDTQVQA